jgi:hypothetical protein
MGLAHSPSVITDGLMIYLDAANTRSYPGTGNTWYDLRGNRNFTLQNNPPFFANSAGGSIGFTAANSHHATATSLPLMTTWTVEVWHYYTGVNSGQFPTIVTEVYPTLINYTIGCTTSSSTNTKLRVGYYPNVWKQTNEYTLTQNTWYQIVGSYDGATIKLYINSTLQLSTADATTPTSTGSGIRLMRRWDFEEYWGGSLSTVKIFNRALSATEIKQNFEATRDRYGI